MNNATSKYYTYDNSKQLKSLEAIRLKKLWGFELVKSEVQ